MSEWTVIRWASVGTCWLQCPNCMAVTRFPPGELEFLYNPKRSKENPNPRPFAKCVSCDFQPYLPLELKRATKMDVILDDPRGTLWATVEESVTSINVETFGVPERVSKWRNQKPD